MEHCYHEWINPAEVPLRPFIFDQGKIVTKFLMQPHQEVLAMPLMKALEEGRITPDLFVPAFSRILKKAIGTDDAKPLMPESMDSSVKTIAKPYLYVIAESPSSDSLYPELWRALTATTEI